MEEEISRYSNTATEIMADKLKLQPDEAAMVRAYIFYTAIMIIRTPIILLINIAAIAYIIHTIIGN